MNKEDLPLIGTQIDNTFINSLIYVRTLEYFEMELLAEYKDKNNTPYIFKWVDCSTPAATTGFIERHLVFPTSAEDIENYLSFKTSLLELIQSGKEFFLTDDDLSMRVSSVGLSDLPETYFPKPEALHDPAGALHKGDISYPAESHLLKLRSLIEKEKKEKTEKSLFSILEACMCIVIAMLLGFRSDVMMNPIIGACSIFFFGWYISRTLVKIVDR